MAVPAHAAVPEVPARLSLGGQTSEARARVIERSAAWRHASALRQLAWWLLLPIVFWIPPHIPWVVVVLGLGAMRAFGRLREHRTLVSVHGVCPKCGTEQDFAETGRMQEPHHTVTCASCKWDLRLEVARAGVET